MGANKIVNVRSTSGGGKSTLVRAVMGLCSEVTPVHIEDCGVELFELPKRGRPIGYRMVKPGGGFLFVPGHYETACGGCDTIAKRQFDNVYALVRSYFERGYDVLYEGLLLGNETARPMQLAQAGYPIHAVVLTTTIEDCLAGIRARRVAKGGPRAEAPFADTVFKNCSDKHGYNLKAADKLEAAGVIVHRLDRAAALLKVRELLGL